MAPAPDPTVEAARPCILITRPEPGASALADRLRAAGAQALVSPLMELRALPAEIRAEGAAAVVLTSANGARCAPEGAALRALGCWCVGEATAEAALAAGFRDVRAGASDAAALAARMLADARLRPGDRVIHLRGVHGTDGFAEALEAEGVRVDAAAVYEMAEVGGLTAAAAEALRAGRVAVAPVYSPRSARLLAEALTAQAPGAASALKAAAISPAAAAPLRRLGLAELSICAAPDGAAMEGSTLALAGLGGPGTRG
ncbi:MAG: uroporphyrinogen-III synthase [Pseudomonadota bacterium]